MSAPLESLAFALRLNTEYPIAVAVFLFASQLTGGLQALYGLNQLTRTYLLDAGEAIATMVSACGLERAIVGDAYLSSP